MNGSWTHNHAHTHKLIRTFETDCTRSMHVHTHTHTHRYACICVFVCVLNIRILHFFTCIQTYLHTYRKDLDQNGANVVKRKLQSEVDTHNEVEVKRQRTA